MTPLPNCPDILQQLTTTPTAAGRENRVVAVIERWIAERPGLTLERDQHGNLIVLLDEAPRTETPLYITAHLDHPAFVTEPHGTSPDTDNAETLTVSFRGGVMAPYFPGARVTLHLDDANGKNKGFIAGTITGLIEKARTKNDQQGPLFDRFSLKLDEPVAEMVPPLTVGVWSLPEAEVIDTDNGAGKSVPCLHTNACDDLAAAAAALITMDRLREGDGEKPDVRLLFTRAEEIGFIGAIGASKSRTMPAGSRVIALETSRSFPHDSPIGGGPILRVGDSISVFSPALTDAVAKAAERASGGPSQPGMRDGKDKRAWPWQRKLMAGGACEATVFCAYGYEATCVCLPLGNYHNMADLTRVQTQTAAGEEPSAEAGGPPRVGREYIALSDFNGMVEMLIACAQQLATDGGLDERLAKLWDERGFVLA